MKLLGMEIQNYAGLQRQFVPLKPGVRLITGKNNAGKTALLNALAIFKGSTGAPYAQQTPPSTLDLIYELENQDLPTINYEPQAEGPAEAGYIARAKFSVTPQASAFIGVDVELPQSPSLAWFTLNAQRTAERSTFNLRGSVVTKSQIATISSFSDLDQILPQFDILRKSLFLPGKRTGVESVAMTTNLAVPVNGQGIASFISTLKLNDDRGFADFNAVVCEMFPEFEYINSRAVANNQVELVLKRKSSGVVIPLRASGTGVEQIVVIVATVLSSSKDQLILLDEPHIFLHPAAERSLIRFLDSFADRMLVVATHSSIFINAVEPSKITYVASRGMSFEESPKESDIPTLLSDLGYQNSDLMFNNRLIFVEGPSDAQILPILLEKAGVSSAEIGWTGFPTLNGANPIRSDDDLSREVLRYERLVSAVGRADLPRMYLFDGDREEDPFNRLKPGGRSIRAHFLTAQELENYLIDCEAIAAAIVQEGRTFGLDISCSAADINAKLEERVKALAPTKREIWVSHQKFPAELKGSEALDAIYRQFGLEYSKSKSGLLIAKKLPAHFDGNKEIAGIFDHFRLWNIDES